MAEPYAHATVAIRPGEDRRLICPEGCSTLDGLPIAPGADLPAEGAVVPRTIWAVRCIGNGDAVLVEPPAPAPEAPAPAAPAPRGRPAPAAMPNPSAGDAA